MNALDHRRQVERAFSAASDYDGQARVQRRAARRLAQRIAALPLPARPRILEIGCGTGFLTEALIAHGLDGEWLITDISPEMVERCRARVGDAPGRAFAVLDGEYGIPEDSFDLVCSSLVLQWFGDHDAAIRRMLAWLAPGGHSVHALLTAGSFAEWRAAHAAEGLEAGTLHFPPAERLAAVHVDEYREHHDSALAFMRALKAIGAHTSAAGHRPLSPAALRRVMRRFEEGGAAVSYEVATCHGRAA
jgi:malonyl-CoA O-methyltransferase